MGLVAGVDDAAIAVAGGIFIAGCIISGACQSAGQALEYAFNSLCSTSADFCHDRFEAELKRCDRWRGHGPADDPNRWQRACEERAAHRRDLCIRNGGQESPDEPGEWSPLDIP